MATREDLRKLQALPLDGVSGKIQRTLGLISEWYAHWENQCCVSFSGGKDSTVLADIAAKWCAIAGIPLDLVFVDTGLEYPEIKEHVRTFAQYLREKYEIAVNLTALRPKMVFADVIAKYGYPMIGKEVSECVYQGRLSLEKNDGTYTYRLKRLYGDVEHPGGMLDYSKWKPLLDVDFRVSNMCCDVMKKAPIKKFCKCNGVYPMTGQMADESRRRKQTWMMYGCNGFDMKTPVSNPMSFWTEQDVLAYIKTKNLPIASVYGDIVYANDPEQVRMDESFCGEKLCTTGCQRTGCIFCGFGAHLESGGYDPEDGLWKPTKEGLGMGHVFDVLNGLYGDGFIPYGKE